MPRRYSCRDLPARAARAASSSRTSSGTSLTVIATPIAARLAAVLLKYSTVRLLFGPRQAAELTTRFTRNVDRGGTPPGPAKNDRVRNLASLAYVVFGVIIASQNAYYTDLTTVSQVVSAVVATALWPLILLGANLHLSLAHL